LIIPAVSPKSIIGPLGSQVILAKSPALFANGDLSLGIVEDFIPLLDLLAATANRCKPGIEPIWIIVDITTIWHFIPPLDN
jgi:hypothetical protein